MGIDWRGLGLAIAAAVFVWLLVTGCCPRVVRVEGIGAVRVAPSVPVGGSYYDGCNTWTLVGENVWGVTTLYCGGLNAIKAYGNLTDPMPLVIGR